jgi:hypothetical protein
MGNYAITAPGFSQALAVSAVSGPAQQSGSPLSNGQTYLTLFKFDTVAQSNKAWVLTAEQYDVFKTGSLTEAALDSAAVGNASGQVWARASATYTGLGSIVVSNLSLFLNAFGGVSASLTVDELRLSNSSLDEATSGSLARPTLRIAKSGNIALLVWSTNFPGFTLERSVTSNSKNWAALANGSIVVADSYVCPVNMNTSAFFRLRKQLP